MVKRKFKLGSALALALSVAALSGTAAAGNGNGNGNDNGNGNATPPGQEKKADQAAPTQQPAPQTTQASAPASHGNSANAPGQQKKQESAKSSASANTSHGNSSHAASTSKDASDGSKQYGNGQTALQVAHAKAPTKTITAADLSEPGNSGHHKITICHNGHLITVDVHALKAHSSHLGGSDVIPATSVSQCQAGSAPQGSSTVQSSCPGTTVVTTKVVAANKKGKVKEHGSAGTHGKHKGLKTSTVTSTSFTPSGASCGSTTSGGAGETQGGQAGASAQTSASAQAGAASQAAQSTAAGGVLGVQATLSKPAKPAAGGVLGVTARLGSTAIRGSLPFTGLPLWIAIVLGVGLVATGAACSRSARSART